MEVGYPSCQLQVGLPSLLLRKKLYIVSLLDEIVKNKKIRTRFRLNLFKVIVCRFMVWKLRATLR